MMVRRVNVKHLILIQLFLTLGLALGGWWWRSAAMGASIAVGGGLMLINLSMASWIWARSFDKKSIAWTSMIIVIKYAVLLASVVIVARLDWFSPLGTGLGVVSFTFTALIVAFYHLRKEKIRLG
jgi:hypothetical protein